MDKKTQLLMQLIKNGDLGGNGGSTEGLSVAGIFAITFQNDANIDIYDFKNYQKLPTTQDELIDFLSSLNNKQVYCWVYLQSDSNDYLTLLASCKYDENNQELSLLTSFGTLVFSITEDDGNYYIHINWEAFLTQIIEPNVQLVGNEQFLESLSFCGTKYEVPKKATKIDYLTTAPTAANYDGLIFVVLNSEPAQRYDGYIYIITEIVE